MATTYVIRGGEEGKRRLDLLAQAMGPSTDAVLERAGVRPGMRCLDLGCGGGHVSRRLATLVGPSGTVVGIDFDPVKLEAARHDAGEEGLTNLEFRQGDVTDWVESSRYDLVFGRFILSHLADRATVVQRMRDALVPRGVLILEDIDFTGIFSHPRNAALDRYCELYRAVVRKRGGDADLGPQLYELCLDAGLQDVDVRAVQPTFAGHVPEKRLHLLTLANIVDAVVAEGMATASEMADHVAALTVFTEDPRAVIGAPRIFQVCGRRI
jgi:trans-aconitate methyltransferase